MACLYKRKNRFWISYYLNGKLVQKSLKTSNKRVVRAKRRQTEYELSLGNLHMASKLPVPVIHAMVAIYEDVPTVVEGWDIFLMTSAKCRSRIENAKCKIRT